jgi:hypothetical protein
MTGAEAYADAVAERASKALSSRLTRTEVFSIGSFTFGLTGPADDPANWMGRAFFAGPPPSQSSPSHELRVWDGNDAENRPPRARWDPADALPLGVISSHSNESIRCAVDFHTESLIVSHFARRQTHTWYPDIAVLPHWAKASPFRIPLSWLCNRHQMQIVHGAAVGINGRAVLLVGDGGSGKSTTALACALAGFDYLGDDYCAIEPAAGKVHMVYRTAKMFGATLDLLPTMRDRVANLDRIEVEKGVAFLDADHVKLRHSAEISAIVLPRVGEGPSMIYPATRKEVIQAVLPSTIGGLMGGTAVTPRLIMELVRSVPAYHLVLRPDIPAVVDAVASCSMAA